MCFEFEFQINFQILVHTWYVPMCSKHFTKRKQVFGFNKIEFQMLRIAQSDLIIFLMSNSFEIQPNSNQLKYLTFSKTKVVALGQFEC